MRIQYGILFVSDMSRSVAFYRDLLKIPLKFQSDEWSEFLSQGATLALHQTNHAASQAKPLRGENAGHCRIGFQVTDLDDFHQRMLSASVPCVQEPTMTFGAKVAQYADPDGLVFSVGELP